MNGGNYRSKGDLSDELVMFRGQKYLLRVVLRPNHYMDGHAGQGY